MRLGRSTSMFSDIRVIRDIDLTIVALGFLVFLNCSNDDVNTIVESEEVKENIKDSITKDTTVASNLLRLIDNKIIDSTGTAVVLQGTGFSNDFWRQTPELPLSHHDGADYGRTRFLGFNSIRFYLNYQWFEDDAQPYIYKEEAWKWLDENIFWAKQNGIYLILNMHAPQGRFTPQGATAGLWTNPENQKRLAALWKAIAERYKDEPVIAGYGPVNEPRPNESIDQWSELAQKLIDTIRSVDSKHILFIERAVAIAGAFESEFETEDLNFPEIRVDDRMVYEFHFYDPFRFTHQLMNFTGLPEGGKYPDEQRLEASKSKWYSASFSDPKLPIGTTDWTYFEGNLHEITDSKIAFSAVGVTANSIGGEVFLDNFEVNEYDAQGNFVRTLFEEETEDTADWNFFSKDKSGTFSVAEGEGYQDSKSLRIAGTLSNANIASRFRFIPRKGYLYQVNGWLKGVNMSPEATASLRLFYYTSPEPVLTRNASYIASRIDRFLDWGKKNGRPMYMGEFGTGAPTFLNNRNGSGYISDILDVAKARDLHFSFHAYRGTNFGIYPTVGKPVTPSEVNTPLFNVFREKLQ